MAPASQFSFPQARFHPKDATAVLLTFLLREELEELLVCYVEVFPLAPGEYREQDSAQIKIIK